MLSKTAYFRDITIECVMVCRQEKETVSGSDLDCTRFVQLV